MTHPTIVVMTAILLAATLPLACAVVKEPALEGAWVLDSIEGPEGAILENPQRGLVLFTDGYFSFTMVAPPDSERNTYDGDEPTDSEKADAFDSFVAGAGQFTLEGDSLITRAYLHINPNAMSEWPNRVMRYTIALEGDVLHWHMYGAVMRFHRTDAISLLDNEGQVPTNPLKP